MIAPRSASKTPGWPKRKSSGEEIFAGAKPIENRRSGRLSSRLGELESAEANARVAPGVKGDAAGFETVMFSLEAWLAVERRYNFISPDPALAR